MTDGLVDPAAPAEPTAPAVPAAEPGVPAPSTETPSIIDKDGNFIEGWRETLDEDIRDEAMLKTIKGVKGMARAFVDTKRMVGKNKIAVPDENSSEGEWGEFHKAGGRPDTAADYNLTMPEGFPEQYYSVDRANAAQELFHKIGLSKKQSDILFKFNNDAVLADIKKTEQDDELAFAELQKNLYDGWGAAYDSKIHLGNIAMEHGSEGDEAYRARLVEKINKDPDLIRFASNLGGKFSEKGGILTPEVPTPGDIQTQINELMQEDVYINAKNAGHKAAVEKVARLFAAKHAQSPKGIT